MNTTLRIPSRLADAIRTDLRRQHAFAHERVGFSRCRYAMADGDVLIGLVHDYQPVADGEYINDPRYGALIGAGAIRRAMQMAYEHAVGILHVHLHDHARVPAPSNVDLREMAVLIPDFFHVRPSLPHGALILSANSASARLWLPGNPVPMDVDRITFVGGTIQKSAASRLS